MRLTERINVIKEKNQKSIFNKITVNVLTGIIYN